MTRPTSRTTVRARIGNPDPPPIEALSPDEVIAAVDALMDLLKTHLIAVEFLGGLLLMIGLATRPAALLLSGTMVVALATAAIPDHKIHANWRGLLDFLYLPEWLLLCLLGWLIFVGAGKLSLDHGLRRRVVRYLGLAQE